MDRKRILSVLFALLVVVNSLAVIAAAEPYDISNINLEKSASISADTDFIQWENGGELLLVADNNNDRVVQYEVSTPYDVGTIGTSTVLDVSSQTTIPAAATYEDSGTRLYVTSSDNTNPGVVEYSLGEAYNLSTASFEREFIPSSFNNPRGLEFKPDGTEMYVFDGDSNDVEQYTLSDPYNVSTASLSEGLAVGSGTRDISVDDDGTILYTLKNVDGNITRYNLTEAYNVSSGVENQTRSVTGSAFDLKPDGSKLYLLDSNTIDQYVLNDAIVSGYVTALGGDPVDGATISDNVSSTTASTNASGYYSIGLDNGGHQLTASHPDFSDATINVTVSGSDLTNQNITMLESDLVLDAEPFMFHGDNQTYSVRLGSDDVTSSATVTSSNSSIVEVLSGQQLLNATDDTSINGTATITAEYQGNTVEKDVTVAVMSAENVDLMPTSLTMTSALIGNVPNSITGERPGGTQLTMQIIIIATLVAVGITRAAGSYAGIGSIVMVMAGGWFMGWVGHGVMLVTIYIALFIGLNVAANSGATLPSRSGWR